MPPPCSSSVPLIRDSIVEPVMQLLRWTRCPAIAFVTPAAYPSDGHGYGASHGGDEPDQVPAVPIDTEAAAALTLSRAGAVAALNAGCFSCSRQNSQA